MNTNKNKPLERIIREFGVKNDDCRDIAPMFNRTLRDLSEQNADFRSKQKKLTFALSGGFYSLV